MNIQSDHSRIKASTLSPEAWQALTNPKTIALIGASGKQRAGRMGFTERLLQTNRDLGYTGEIFLINPGRDEILGQKAWPSLDALPRKAEFVAINLPDEKVMPEVRRAIAHGAKAMMIHSGGFGERGAEGLARETELKQLAAEAGIPVIGPNGLGIMSLTNRVSASNMKPPANAAPGSIAAISQSGSVASILSRVSGRFGLSFLASTGNEAVTTTEDLIGYAIDDPATKVIIAFIEALRRPREIFGLAERAHNAGKPIIVVKSGLTERGGEVSRGHTGAFAGAGAVYRKAFEQAGIILCDDFNELAQTVELFAGLNPPPKRCRIGMLGTSGGELGVVTDHCVMYGAALPVLSGPTLAALQATLALPPDVFPRNPVDAGTGFKVGGSYKDRMLSAIEDVAKDPEVDVLVVMQAFSGAADDQNSVNKQMMSAAAAYAGKNAKPIVVMATESGQADDHVMSEVREAKVPALEGARESLRALRNLDWYGRYLAAREGSLPVVKQVTPPAAWDNGIVPQAELFPWLAKFGLPVTPVFKATSAAEAKAAVEKLAGPAVMKIDTSRVVHKSDIGGVALGVTPDAAAEQFEKLRNVLTPSIGAVSGESVIIAPFVSGGVEFYIGAKNDPSFGPVVVLGLGGRMLEIMERTALLVAPFTRRDALDAIAQSGAGKLLAGFRGGPKADLDALAEMAVKVGEVALALGASLDVLDLNPVIVNAQNPAGIVADARLVLKSAKL